MLLLSLSAGSEGFRRPAAVEQFHARRRPAFGPHGLTVVRSSFRMVRLLRCRGRPPCSIAPKSLEPVGFQANPVGSWIAERAASAAHDPYETCRARPVDGTPAVARSALAAIATQITQERPAMKRPTPARSGAAVNTGGSAASPRNRRRSRSNDQGLMVVFKRGAMDTFHKISKE